MYGSAGDDGRRARYTGCNNLASVEGGVPVVIKRHMIEATDEDTRVSTMYTGKTLRALYSKFPQGWDSSGLEPLPFPIQILIASMLPKGFIEADADEYIGGFAGQASVYVKDINPAAEILLEMVGQAEDILTRCLPQSVEAE